MNDKKIAFIICWDDERYLIECLNYIERLRVPEGYETDVITIGEADSIYEAYNAAMHSSDAGYKVYIRENIFIHYEQFIEEFLYFFRLNPDFKMAGVLPEDKESRKQEFQNAAFIDGALMITREDLEWREDILKGFSYYDKSQCMEFRRKGFKIGGLTDPSKWFIRAYKTEGPDKYILQNAEAFSADYFSVMENEKEQILKNKVRSICERELPAIEELINKDQHDDAFVRLSALSKARSFDAETDDLLTYMEIVQAERKSSRNSFNGCRIVEDIGSRITEIRFLCYRILADSSGGKFFEEYDNGTLSLEALARVSIQDKRNNKKIGSAVRQILSDRYDDELKWGGICSFLTDKNDEEEQIKEKERLKTETERRERDLVRSVYFNRYYANKEKKGWFTGKGAVYTCITGGYDNICDPEVINPEWDYYCFTDNPSLKSEVWNIVTLDNEEGLDSFLLSRKVKMLPMSYLKDYDYTIWIDGNIQVTGNIEDYIRRYERDSSMICFPHPRRVNIHQEADAINYYKKSDEMALRKQIDRYEKEGFTDESGLCCAGMIVRSNHDPLLTEVMKQWFDEVKTESRRDQMSLGYVCWKNDYSYDICDLVIYDNQFIRLNKHI